MKTMILFAALILSGNLFCQDSAKFLIENKVYIHVEEPATFPGGDEGLRTFVKDNLKYPYHSKLYEIQGTVELDFIVDKKGNLSDISVRKGVSTDLDAEAIRLAKLFPKLKPAKHKGKPVEVFMYFPIEFKLKGAANIDTTDIPDIDLSTALEKMKKGGDYFLAYKTSEKYIGRQNYIAARPYLKIGAEKHYPPALRELGYIYEYGRSVPQNYDTAIIYLTEAAELGDDEAQIDLGYMYAKGWGVSSNKSTAKSWYEKSAAQDNKYAISNLGYFYSKGIGGVAENDSLAKVYYFRAAELGNNNAQNWVGHIIEYGMWNTGVDTDRAFIWYFKAAEQKNVQALSKLGDFYRTGRGNVKRNDTLSLGCYLVAAEKGDAHAEFHIGYMFQKGMGVVEPDTDKAMLWYDMSAKQHNTDALNNYAWLCYLKGVNIPKAIEYVKESLQNAPDNINRLDTYAGLLFLSERYDEAQKWEKKALDLGGDKKDGYLERYGDILFKLNRVEEARLYWQKALDMPDHSSKLVSKLQTSK